MPSFKGISKPSRRDGHRRIQSNDRFNKHVGLLDTSFPPNSFCDGLRDCGCFLDWESGPDLADVRLQGERRGVCVCVIERSSLRKFGSPTTTLHSPHNLHSTGSTSLGSNSRHPASLPLFFFYPRALSLPWEANSVWEKDKHKNNNTEVNKGLVFYIIYEDKAMSLLDSCCTKSSNAL